MVPILEIFGDDGSADSRVQGARLPSPEDLRNAAAVLDEGEKIAILAGAGALAAGRELEEVAEKLGAPGLPWQSRVCLRSTAYDFAAVARASGGKEFTLDDPKQCGRVLDQAFATQSPALVDAIVDTHTPPMPPKATVKQAANFAESLAKGTPNRRSPSPSLRIRCASLSERSWMREARR